MQVSVQGESEIAGHGRAGCKCFARLRSRTWQTGCSRNDGTVVTYPTESALLGPMLMEVAGAELRVGIGPNALQCG